MSFSKKVVILVVVPILQLSSDINNLGLWYDGTTIYGHHPQQLLSFLEVTNTFKQDGCLLNHLPKVVHSDVNYSNLVSADTLVRVIVFDKEYIGMIGI